VLVHGVCYGEIYSRGDLTYCDICEREVNRGEILVVDESPSSFSG